LIDAVVRVPQSDRKEEATMLSQSELLSVIAMIAGFLIQNVDEWRSNGPTPPDKGRLRRFFPEVTDRTRLHAVVIISVVVPLACLASVLATTFWPLTAIAAALGANAVIQAGASWILKRPQPGTWTGLLLMLPASLWVIVMFRDRSGWPPLLIGPLLAAPVLFGVWWLAHLTTVALGKRPKP
jgi:hypothetical protein